MKMLPEKIEISPDWSIYEKTLFFHIMRYLEDPLFAYTQEDWMDFCSFYRFDFSLIQPYLSAGLGNGNIPLTYKGKTIREENAEDLQALGLDASQFLCHPRGRAALLQRVVTDMFRCVFIRKNLESVRLDDSRDSLWENIHIYRCISYHLSMLNSEICTRECLEKGNYSTKRIPQIAGARNAQAMQRMLQSLWLIYGERKEILVNLYHAYQYSTLHTLDMLILILGLQVIKYSPFFCAEEQEFCDKLLKTVMKLLRNARVIAIFKSDAYFDRELAWMERGSRDRTTRLQVLYEYENGDQYSLRLDLPHKGVPFFHLNSQSRGKVEYFPLDESAYRALVKQNPAYGQLFIEYENGLYFLRENAKTLVSRPEPGYEKLAAALKENEHFPVGCQLGESEILNLLAVWCELLSSVAGRMPDSEKIDPVKVYRVSKIYSFMELCCYAELEGGPSNGEKLRRNILQFLRGSRILSEEEAEAFADVSGMEILTYAIKVLEEQGGGLPRADVSERSR